MCISDKQDAFTGLLHEDFITAVNLNAFYEEIEPLKKSTQRMVDKLKLVADSDEKIGKVKNDENNQIYAITKKYLNSETVRNNIFNECEIFISTLDLFISDTQDEVLDLANTLPQDITLRNKRKLDLSGRKKEKVTLTDLNRLFVWADKNEYKKITGLINDSDIQLLHDKMAQYINFTILKTQYTKIKNEIVKIETNDFNLPEKIVEITQLGKALSTKNCIPLNKQTAIQFFQKEEEILITPIQQFYLNKLLTRNKTTNKFNNEVIQLIMGGGKSKVIGPLAALKKANGTNLVIFEVKNSLLKINHADMRATSQRLFNQQAILFEFDRYSSCTSADLKKLYHLFQKASIDKNYIVTSGTSLQSLELKYLETLSAPPRFFELEKKAEWKKQIKWFEKSLLLIKNKGDRIIDEIHDELDPSKELNYTITPPCAPSKQDKKTTIDLFYFLRHVSISEIVGGQNFSAYDLILNNKLISNPVKQLDGIMQNIARALITNTQKNSNNPISKVIEKLALNAEQSEDLIAYLLNKNDKILPFLKSNYKSNKLSKLDCDKLAFVKFELSKILPFTLTKNYNEHYGSSRKAGISPLQKTLAIPYQALHTPNEKAHFGQYFEALNYTMQMNIIRPLSKKLILDIFEKYLKEARAQEVEANLSLNAFEQTQASKDFNKKYSPIIGLTLKEISELSEEALIKYATELKRSDELKKILLAEEILPRVKINPLTLSSNSQNLAQMTHTTQGMTGTPFNHLAYHQDIYFNEADGLGTDGETIDLLKRKNTKVIVSDHYANVESLLDEILEKDPIAFKKVRAVIDVGALFNQEVSNFEVAKKIANFYLKNPTAASAKIKFVLFFGNEDNKLYALNILTNEKFKIEGTDEKEIAKILNCKPEERFTLYDQARITGTDITQSSDACALITFSDKTTKSSFLQGLKRLRQFANHQSARVILPRYMESRLTATPKIESVLDFMDKNQVENCLAVHLKGAVHKLKTLFEMI